MLMAFVDNARSVSLSGRVWSAALARRNALYRLLARHVGGRRLRRASALSTSSSRGDQIITKDAWNTEIQLNNPSTSQETLDLLRNLLGFSDQELARALGVKARSVKRWRAGGQISTESEECLFDLKRTVVALAELELPPANVRAWFFYRNQFLQEERPIDVFTSGRYAALRPAIDAMADAAFA
jgi:DNA-binding transcriptional regulator YiaG